MRLYHRSVHATAILQQGFKDGTGMYLTELEWTGVWLADRPDVAAEAADWPLLAVDIDEPLVSYYEWVEEGSTYREWCVPAALLNEHASVELIA